ncbi:MAG: hypothetical protein JWP63_5979 [Candidatus Solibacter sp.]|nr:hypothetical protein [Candidatus Solibacter sp.]
MALAAFAIVSQAAVKSPAQLPYAFEANHGQTDASVRYLARGRGYTLFLTGNEAVLRLHDRSLRMSLIGARDASAIEPVGANGGKSNYFVGRDTGQWRRDVPLFDAVRYRGVYQGVDLLYHGHEGQLEYDFVVSPGARPADIGVRFQGAEKMRVNRAGELELAMSGQMLVHRRPVAYQQVDGERREIAAAYELRDGVVRFRLGEYDRDRELVIDPVVVYSTFIGGNLGDQINAVAVDKDGNTYLTGQTTSIDFPVVGTPFTQLQGSIPYAFVTKLNAAGNKIVFSSYLGGSSNTNGLAIAVDKDANVYLGGVTGARNFPLVNATQTQPPSANIGFVTKVAAAGDKLLFSTYLGGDANDRVDALALDAAGSIYVTGYATSANLPVVTAFQPKIAGSNDALVAKFQAPDYRIAYCSFLGGPGADDPYGIAVDAAGSAYVTGYTVSPNLATTGVYQTKYASGGDTFIAKVTPSGNALAFFTYLGGSGDDRVQAIALDASGNPIVAGSTTSKNFPVTAGAVQKDLKGNTDVFVAKVSANGAQVLYATYLGGTQSQGSAYLEEARGVAVDPQGNIVITGITNSTDFPSVRAIQSFSGAVDSFLTVLNPAGDKIVYSTPIGGAKDDIAHAVAVDSTGAAYVAGHTLSADFPMKNALRPAFAGNQEAFLTKICDPILILSQSSLSFVSFPGQPAPAAQTVSVSACTAIPFTASSSGGFLKVAASAGTTNATLSVTVDPTGLKPGTYRGTITVTAPDAINSPRTIDVVLQVAPPPGVISAAGIVNAASGRGGPVAPGELVVIYGSNIGPDQLESLAVDSDDKVTTQAGNTRVLFDGVPAPMIYASAGQSSAIVPYSVQGKATVKVEVERFGVRSNAVTMAVDQASPALFTANASGSGPGAILNQDGGVNGPGNPADSGSVVILFATGEGQTNPGGVDGLLAVKALPKPMQSVRVTIGDQPAEVLYAGAAPSMVAGVMQVNVKLPAGVTGNVPVVVAVGSKESPATVTVSVR